MLSLLGITLFVSAFLLFCCEPMIGKMVLPILGGAASVWTTCVLFFQAMLLAGYVYTHFLGKLQRLRDQMLIHVSLMLLALAFMPIRMGAVTGRPSEAPVSWLLWHLILVVGVPFAVISATAPLLQNWLGKTPIAVGRDPYFLYAASNAGSLLALLAYPVLVEPRYGVSGQSRLWLDGYGVLLVLVAVCGILLWRESRFAKPADAAIDETGPAPDWRLRRRWLAAAFIPSALMLAVTNHISLNIGSVPFLWVAPLAVYLLTFIMAFARRLRLPTTIISSISTVVLLLLFPIAAVAVPVSANAVWKLMGCHIAILFFGALLCHSALADRRPSPKYLTEYYFVLALGGVLGGIFAAIVAPAVFSTTIEYPLLVATLAFFREPRSAKPDGRWFHYAAVLGFAAFVGLCLYGIIGWAKIDITQFSIAWEDLKTRDNMSIALAELALVLGALMLRKHVRSFALAFASFVMIYAVVLPKQFESASRLFVARDFFGVKKVLYSLDENMRKLVHGDTMHGLESLDVTLAGQPLSYYHPTGPIGDVMELISHRTNQHVGVVGLGTGTMAAYGGRSRRITFFDVDPQVAGIAHDFFTYIRRCADNCNVVIGDGRLAIAAQPDAEFDVIILDAFNSDSIPAHLVSREAVRMYMTKLKPGGVLLFHVSNRYLNVEKLATIVSMDEGLPVFVRHDDDESPRGKAASDYVAAVRSAEDLDNIPNKDSWEEPERPTDIKSWTDDYSNMMSVIRWK
jgi:spermidine synthase